MRRKALRFSALRLPPFLPMWPHIIPFFDYPPEIRKVIYTTNAIESVNMSLRKVTKNRGSFPRLGSLYTSRPDCPPWSC